MRFGPIPKHKTDKELLWHYADMLVEAMCGDDHVPVDVVDERKALYDLVCALDPIVPVDTENANATDTLIRDLVEEARAILCTPPVQTTDERAIYVNALKKIKQMGIDLRNMTPHLDKRFEGCLKAAINIYQAAENALIDGKHAKGE